MDKRDCKTRQFTLSIRSVS